MPSKTKQLVESSLMLGTALVLLFLTKYTLLGAVAVFLVPLPFLLLAMSMTASSMVWICLAFGFLGWIVTDPNLIATPGIVESCFAAYWERCIMPYPT